MSRRLWWRAGLAAALAACVDGPGGPGRFGEVRVEPAYRAGYEPAAIGVALDTAAVLVERRGTGERLVDTTMPYSGGALAWIVDLLAAEESLAVAVELYSAGSRLYQGDTTVVAEDGTVAGETHALAVAYVGPPRVAVVTVTPATASLTAVGATRQFTAEARDPNGDALAGVTFVWSTSNATVATVDTGTGLATAAGHGAATISATANGISGSATLDVDLTATVDTVIVSPATATLTTVGATRQFTAEARDANGNTVPGLGLTWSSSAAAVAAVDSTGLATATGHGSATITATTSGKTGAATLSVDLVAVVDTVVVTPATATLTTVGATQQFTAEARDSTGAVVPGLTFTWTSSALTVATVDPNGRATAIGHGSTAIIAATGSKSGSASLTVNLVATVDTVVVTPAAATLTALGGTRQFAAEARDSNGTVLPGITFVWATSAAGVATVDSGGVTTATGQGTATITATAAGRSGTATVTVDLVATVDTIVVTPAAAALPTLGATQQFAAEARDSNGTVLPGITFGWATSATGVATVDSSGLATATGHGTATIRATAAGKSGSATVTVNLVTAVDTVIVTPAATTLTAVDQTQQFTAEARDSIGTVLPGIAFAWATSAAGVATVNSSGLARATGHGSTVITATTAGKSGTASLTVNLLPVVDTVIVSPPSAILSVLGATRQFTAEARDSNGSVLPGVAFAWASALAAVATVDSTGLATATGHGTTTITATAAGKSGAATLTVDLLSTVDTVIVTPGAVTLAAFGASQAFTAEARDSSGAVVPGIGFVWASGDATVAAIDSVSGVATVAGNGAAIITARTGTVSGAATLTVAQQVVSVVVAPGATTLTALGATLQLAAEALDANGHIVAGATFAWQSDDATVVSVDPASGLARAEANGSARIIVTTGAVGDSATVTVAQVVSSVAVTPGTTTLAAFGATEQLTAEARDANGHVVPGVAFAWMSDNAAVTVDSGGLAAALANGTATVTATTGTVAGTATVTVAQVVTTVTVTPASASLSAVGATQQLTAEARDANGHLVAGAALAWSASDAAVAGVDAVTGLVTAVGNGSATVTADAGTAAGSADVNVAQVVATIVVQPDSATLVGIEQFLQFAATALDANGHAIPGVGFAWSSSNVSVARVNASGRAVSVGFGTATIQAAASGVVGTATLMVVP